MVKGEEKKSIKKKDRQEEKLIWWPSFCFSPIFFRLLPTQSDGPLMPRPVRVGCLFVRLHFFLSVAPVRRPLRSRFRTRILSNTQTSILYMQTYRTSFGLLAYWSSSLSVCMYVYICCMCVARCVSLELRPFFPIQNSYLFPWNLSCTGPGIDYRMTKVIISSEFPICIIKVVLCPE